MKRMKELILVGICLAAFAVVPLALAQDDVVVQPIPSEPEGAAESELDIPIDAAPNNTPATAFPIQCGQTLGKHVTAANEVDWFKFTAYPGFSLAAFVQASEIGYSNVDAKLTLYAGNATTILNSNDNYDGEDPRLHWTTKGIIGFPPDPSTYYLKVEDLDDSSLGYYHLTLDRANYFSMATSGTIGGVTYEAGDVLAYYPCKAEAKWAMFLDMSDVGVLANTDGIAVLPGNDFILSFKANTTIRPIGVVTKNDLVVLNATDVGNDTAGTFSVLLDGSDVGLTTTGEAIDAVMVTPGGKLAVSISGSGAVPGVATVKDEDMLRFTASSFGANTNGSWAMHFDGTDEALGSVDLVNAWQRPEVNFLIGTTSLFTTFDAAVVADGEPFDGGDIASCNAVSLGPQTDCPTWNMHIDVSVSGFGASTIDALDKGDITSLLNYP